jgi:hypothetical protein
MTDAKDSPDLVSNTDTAKKETKKPSKKLASSTVKDVISKSRTMTGSPPNQININPFQESAGQEHTAVMAFGRFNPPTIGHEKLIRKVEDTAKSVGGSAHIIASHSEGDSKNPLPSGKKVGYIKKVAEHGTHVYASSKAQPTLLHHAAALHKHAHHLVVVAGQDRVKQFHDLLHKYNGKEGPHGFYNFKSIKVVSAGQRDPDAEGTEGMSGTKMREHAKNGNEAAFRSGLPKALHAHASEMMQHIQKVTGVQKEEMDAFSGAVHSFIMENTPITNEQANALDIKSIKSGIELDNLVEAYCYGYHTGLISEKQTPEQVGFQTVNSLIANSLFNEDLHHEDLRQWFKDKWVRMDTKGNIKGDCAREPGEGKPKCLPIAKARAMDKEDRATAVNRKRKEDPVADRAGKGGKPINVQTEAYALNEAFDEACWTGYKAKGMKKKGNKMVPNCVPEAANAAQQAAIAIAMKKAGKKPKNEEVEHLEEKNAPTNPSLWSRAKALAKSKFDVYPSAYANGWASKWYKSKGGGWKSVSEATSYDTSYDTAAQTQRSHDTLSPQQKAKAKARAAAAGRPYPNSIDTLWAVNEENINEISNELVGRVNKLRTLGPNPGSGVPPKPHKTVAGAKTLQTAVNKVRFKSKVGAPPMKESIDTAFGAMLEAKDKGEYDYEGDMAMSQLRSIMHNAQQIHDMLEPNTNMPEWVQSKITLAADYISTCADYLESNKDA